MKPPVWRAVALVLILVSIAFACYQMTTPERDDFGIGFNVPTSSPGQIRVTSVAAGSPAERAGLREGDLIGYGQTALERAHVRYATPGSRVTIVVNGSHMATFTARRLPPIGRSTWPNTLIRLAFLLVAALLAWRRPEDPAARSLSVFLWCYGLAIGLSNGVLPDPLLSLVFLQFGDAVLFLAGTAAAASFAANFPSASVRPAPRVMARAAQIVAVAAACALAAGDFLVRSATTVSVINAGIIASFVILGALVFATLAVAYLQGAPEERQRRQWVFLLIAIGLFGPIVDIAVQSTLGYQAWLDTLTVIPLAMLPIGLAYVILRHRVIDVGFVLNRAVVYTGVSFVVVAVFVIVETLLSKYVEQSSHAGSIAVQLAVALVLGFSIRAIHARVDRFVDTMLFRERHEAEQAMRDFAHDAGYITDTRILLRRCMDVVRRCADTHDAGIWLRQDGGMYAPAEGTFAGGAVDENDPAVVAMRSRRVIADLRAMGSALPGAIAFPMIVRGELLGVLVCGPKSDDQTFAPDEREALAVVAAAVGHGLDGLRVAELEATVQRLLALQTGGATQGAMGTF